MKINELFEERVSIRSLVTSPRIDPTPAVGYYAVVQGNKLWKTNLLSAEEAKQVKKTYEITKPGTRGLRVVFITK